MNPWLQRILGGGQMALGAMRGDPRAMQAGMGRIGDTMQGHAIPTPIAPTPLPAPTAGAPGPGIPPAPMAFRMPSAYGVEDNNGLY
jgi:hypothetical protein